MFKHYDAIRLKLGKKSPYDACKCGYHDYYLKNPRSDDGIYICYVCNTEAIYDSNVMKYKVIKTYKEKFSEWFNREFGYGKYKGKNETPKDDEESPFTKAICLYCHKEIEFDSRVLGEQKQIINVINMGMCLYGFCHKNFGGRHVLLVGNGDWKGWWHVGANGEKFMMATHHNAYLDAFDM